MYRPVKVVDDQPTPAPPGEVTWSTEGDPRTHPLRPDLGANDVCDLDVWTDGRRRRLLIGNRWKLSEAVTIGIRYDRHFDLLIPDSSPFDVVCDLPMDLIAEHRSAYVRYYRSQEALGAFWDARGGQRAVLTPLPIKGGVTFLSQTEPQNPLIGDRWIKGTDRHGPAQVWTTTGWRDQEARTQ
jgi:hypothetical protein